LISVSPKTKILGRYRFRPGKVVLGITEIEGGFPHSEIRGSKLVRSSPRLIAAYHVLHRLSAPRHSPNTLMTLDRSHYRCPPLGSGRFRLYETVGLDVFKDQFASNASKNGAVKLRPQILLVANAFDTSAPTRCISFSRCQLTNGAQTLQRRKLIADDDCSDTRVWWSQTGSNRRPHACKARALPTELWPRASRATALMQAGRRKTGSTQWPIARAGDGGPGKT
jgi:hypothetical protein